MTNAELFLEKYKQLEEAVRITYNLNNQDSISYYLTSQAKYQRYRAEINYCQEVRNLISHRKKVNDNFAVEPSREMLNFIDQLLEQIKNRMRNSKIKINMNNVFWQPMSGNVKKTINTMRNNLFTHVPIMENGVVVGVFDENSVFDYLANEEIIAIDDSLTFESMKKYISLTGREMEEFLFYKENSYVEELENKFEEAFRKGKRIGIVFLTQNGKPNEKLLGIITPWDIIASAE